MAIREVTVKNGRLLGAPSGIPSTTVFRGVPYAAPPVGDLRWKPPAPAADWEGVRLAHSFADMCIQPAMPEELNKENLEYPEPMSEDCLYLNIWTPANSVNDKLPVLLWIHGGAFYAGHSYGTNVDGDYFAKKGVILVSVGYRLGVFGFLGHPELSKESPHGVCGNYGILDQIFALDWVRENISAFGGDPEKITIAGQSAGSSSVQTLISSPLSRSESLHGAVMMSGVGMPTVEFIAPGTLGGIEDFGVKLFSEMGISSVAEARAIDGHSFFERAWAANSKLSGPFGMPFKPAVDGYVLPMSPSDAARQSAVPDIYYMVGHTDEGMLDPPTSTESGYKAWLEKTFGSKAEDAAKSFAITTDAELQTLRPDSIRTGLVAASHAFCRSVGTKNKKPCYYYYFSHKLPGDDKGAFHSGELWYFFNKLHRCWRPFASFDYSLAKSCADYLMNFVKTGNPNGDDLPYWAPDTAEASAVMSLADPIQCKYALEHPGIEFMINASLGKNVF